jgi:signal peptidase I
MGKWLRVIGWVSVVLGVIVGALRLTVISWWQVPSDDPALSASIAPSLYPGDWVLLYNKTPVFGDLTRCQDPQEPRRFVVGRVMGEPRDSIELNGWDVVVNNKRSVQEHRCSNEIVHIPDPSTGTDIELYCAIEGIVSHKHMRGTSTKNSPYNVTTRKATVGDDHFYLVSDNRVFPMDSREYGAVLRGTCKEQIFFRLVGQKGFGDAQTRLSFIQ